MFTNATAREYVDCQSVVEVEDTYILTSEDEASMDRDFLAESPRQQRWSGSKSAA